MSKNLNKEVKMKKLMNKVVVLILIMFMLVISIAGNSYAANNNKYPDGMIPANHINETFLRDYVLKRLPEGAKLISIGSCCVLIIAKMF